MSKSNALAEIVSKRKPPNITLSNRLATFTKIFFDSLCHSSDEMIEDDEEKPDAKEALKITVWWHRNHPISTVALVILGVISGGIGLLYFPIFWFFMWSGWTMNNAISDYRKEKAETV